MREGDVEISRRARVVKALLLAVHLTRRLFVTTAFGLMFTAAEGWILAFIIFAWVLYVIDNTLSDLDQRNQRERQLRGQIEVAPNVTITVDQAERIFAIFHESAPPRAGQSN